MAKGRTPNGRQRFVDLEHVGDLDDALGSVGATRVAIFNPDAAKLILIQTGMLREKLTVRGCKVSMAWQEFWGAGQRT